MKPNKIGVILANDSLIVENIATLHNIFDIPQAKVTIAVNLVKIELKKTDKYIEELVSTWRRTRISEGIRCTGRHLITILKIAGYFSAAGIKLFF